MKISEIITDKYKLRIPPTVYYELLADVQDAEEEQDSAVISGNYSNATNGEVIKLLFPTAETRADEDECCMKVHFPDAFNIECFDLVWWNDKYDGK